MVCLAGDERGFERAEDRGLALRASQIRRVTGERGDDARRVGGEGVLGGELADARRFVRRLGTQRGGRIVRDGGASRRLPAPRMRIEACCSDVCGHADDDQRLLVVAQLRRKVVRGRRRRRPSRAAARSPAGRWRAQRRRVAVPSTGRGPRSSMPASAGRQSGSSSSSDNRGLDGGFVQQRTRQGQRNAVAHRGGGGRAEGGGRERVGDGDELRAASGRGARQVGAGCAVGDEQGVVVEAAHHLGGVLGSRAPLVAWRARISAVALRSPTPATVNPALRVELWQQALRAVAPAEHGEGGRACRHLSTMLGGRQR